MKPTDAGLKPEATSRLSDEACRLLVEAVQEYAIFLLDTQGNIVSWNAGAQRIKGYRAEEIIGKHFSCFYPREAVDRNWPQQVLDRAASQGTFEDEGWRIRKDGAQFWASAAITALRDEAGNLRGFAKVTRDLSDRKQVEEVLQRAHADLEDRVRQRTAELARTNEILQAEIAHRRQVEQELRKEHEHLHTTLASIGDGVIVTDATGRVTFLNPIAQALTGWQQEEAEGKELETVFRICNEQTRVLVDNPVAKVLAQGLICGLANHTLLIARDGTARPIDDSAAPIRDEQGNTIGVVLVFRDIVERRRVEQSLREGEARKTAILETALDCIITIDHEGKIVEFNPAAERTFGYSRAEALGQAMAELIVPPSLRARHYLGLTHYLATGEGPVLNKRIEMTGMRADGTEFPIELAITRIPTEGLPLFTGYVRDITERKRLERELAEELARRTAVAVENERLYREISEAAQRKDEFLAMLAHELRNPLAPMRNALHILKMKGTDRASVDLARDMMDRQFQSLVRLVDDLLDVSRIMRGRVELRKERVELASVITRAVETVHPVMDAHGHELEISLPPESLLLEADPVRLAQAIANLLHNACKYTEKAGHIRLTALRAGNEVVIKVRDSGIGIAPEMLPRVFDLFMQVDRSFARSRGGLGIGLTLVRNLVEMHGGSVRAASAGLGKGSEFEMRLPVLSQESAALARPEKQHHGSEKIARRRVLVVDDNVDAAESVVMLLRLWNHETRAAHDGLAALEAARAFQPDVILLDIGLPGIDGYEVARRLRDRPEFSSTLLVAMTGYGQDKDRLQSRQTGFDEHLVKPVEPHVLQQLLQGRLSRQD